MWMGRPFLTFCKSKRNLNSNSFWTPNVYVIISIQNYFYLWDIIEIMLQNYLVIIIVTCGSKTLLVFGDFKLHVCGIILIITWSNTFW